MAELEETVSKLSQGVEEGLHVDEKQEEKGDPYRSHLYGDGEVRTAWRHGAPPAYELVNSLFEKERTKEWPKGSLEEVVQNLVKTWEMELSHKTNVRDFKTIDPDVFTISVNGGPALTAEQTLKVGSYNALMATTLPGEHDTYKASEETFESSHEIFRAVFTGGFAWEVLDVYSPPPRVVFKYRHWGLMQGPFKGHPPTDRTATSIGIVVANVDESLRITSLEVYYDPTMFLGDLTAEPKSSEYGAYQKGVKGCPFLDHATRTHV